IKCCIESAQHHRIERALNDLLHPRTRRTQVAIPSYEHWNTKPPRRKNALPVAFEVPTGNEQDIISPLRKPRCDLRCIATKEFVRIRPRCLIAKEDMAIAREQIDIPRERNVESCGCLIVGRGLVREIDRKIYRLRECTE